MTIDNLSLPVDIPWERRCVSEDMITDDVCDREFPDRFRSSVSVFSYEPPEDYQEYEGMTVSYLKVVGTITSYQPSGEQVGLDDGRAASGWMDPNVYENYKKQVERAYGCYGAILELGVAPPAADEWGSAEYPYVADFQPKKREVYELATETNEQTSRTLENINVRKGTTTTDSHEILDVFGGFNAGVRGQAGSGAGGEVNFGNRGQWGTRDMNTEEYTNIRTTDRAREQRESYSHTTRLTQMYHQLDSYHLGTNRAMFFMVPRPHIKQSKRTFVNGPRKLEGIQEFFLVVLRPEEMETFDIEAYLETAHIGSTPNYTYETGTRSTSLDISASCEGDPSGTIGDDSKKYHVEDAKTYTPPDGWEIDTDRKGGYEISAKSGDRIDEAGVKNVGPNQLTLHGRIHAWFEDRTWPTSNKCHEGDLHLEVTVYIRKEEPEVESYDQKLWVTGRGICCRAHEYEPEDVEFEEETESTATVDPESISTRESYAESVTYETSLDRTTDERVGGETSMSVDQANTLASDVKRSLYDSVNASDRYAAGTVDFASTEFLSESIGTLIRSPDHPDNRPVTHLAALDDPVREKVAATAPQISRGRVLQAPLAELRDRFSLDHGQAVHLKRAALGLEMEAPSPEARWQRPSLGEVYTVEQGQAAEQGRTAEREGTAEQRRTAEREGTAEQGRTAERGRTVEQKEAVEVPDVEGLDLSEARARLADVGLTVGDRRYADDEQPRDSVRNQYPDAGESVDAGSAVDLVLSTGLSVRIPDVVGDPLPTAVERLAEAGLESEPGVQFAPSDERPANHVLEVTPSERTYVTPNERVVLQVVGEREDHGK